MRNVQAMILCTRDHRCDSHDGRILVDADLAILGSPPEQYRVYADAIQRECAAIPEDRFRLGRMKVLQSLLGRGKIFQTMRGQRSYEEAARRNLARELAELTIRRPALTAAVAPLRLQRPRQTPMPDASPVGSRPAEQPHPGIMPATSPPPKQRATESPLPGERSRKSGASHDASPMPAKNTQ
jgi:hypothetical protein